MVGVIRLAGGARSSSRASSARSAMVLNTAPDFFRGERSGAIFGCTGTNRSSLAFNMLAQASSIRTIGIRGAVFAAVASLEDTEVGLINVAVVIEIRRHVRRGLRDCERP